ncbi:DMT family transporter [Flocculibacter collagenilyticus]|uniref:DMT family transporter n=1 Tax=Flocculibacter collagenilyticus TaxID=2744479 RepID=UPI0018F5D852|nr:DMT family transporter [Flocculibacter collagenilyticus]
MHDKNQSIALKYGLVAVLLWSTVATAFKLALNTMSPTQLLFIASVTTSIVLFIIILKQNKLGLVGRTLANTSSYAVLIPSALLNPVLYYITLFSAYDLLPAQQAQSINYTWAITLSLLAAIFLKQKLTKIDMLALLLAYVGTLIISTKGDVFSLQFESLLGVSLALISTFLWGIYWIINVKNTADAIVTLFLSFLISLPILFIMLVMGGELNSLTTEGIWYAIYIGLFEMGITFVLWLKALKYAENTTQISSLIFISPFISLIFIYLILQEPIYSATLLGLVFIVTGLVLQQKCQNKTPSQASYNSDIPDHNIKQPN